MCEWTGHQAEKSREGRCQCSDFSQPSRSRSRSPLAPHIKITNPTAAIPKYPPPALDYELVQHPISQSFQHPRLEWEMWVIFPVECAWHSPINTERWTHRWTTEIAGWLGVAQINREILYYISTGGGWMESLHPHLHPYYNKLPLSLLTIRQWNQSLVYDGNIHNQNNSCRAGLRVMTCYIMPSCQTRGIA